MSDLFSVSAIVIATGVAAIIGLFLIRTFFGAFADYLDEIQHFRHPIKPKKKIIFDFKKQIDNQ